MQFATSLSALAAVLSAAGAIATDIPIGISLVQGAVGAVEQTGKSGADKLTAVLMQSEVGLAAVAPHIGHDMQGAMTAVRNFVDALVADYNRAKIFVHTAEQAVVDEAHKLGIG